MNRKATGLTLLACPACSGPVSPAASTCPHCGHPLTPTLSPEAQRQQVFAKDIQRIRRRAALLLILLTLPTLGISTLVAWLSSPSLANLKDAAQLLQIYAVTAPMTLGVALCVVALFFKGWSGVERVLDGGYPALAASLVAACTLFALPALAIGLCMEKPIVDLMPLLKWVWTQEWQGIGSLVTKPLLFLYLVLHAYWQAYGPWPFASAILLGIFIGWVVLVLQRYPDLLWTRCKALLEL